jgi:hypothetical protein
MPAKFVFKGVAATGDLFHRIVASCADKSGIEIPKALFNYDESGPMPITSPFRWCGNGKSVWLRAVTDEAESQALPHIKSIASALKHHLGSVPAVTIVDQPMSASPLPYAIDYAVLNMIVDVPKQHQGSKESVEAFITENLTSRVAESFSRQAKDIGLDIPVPLQTGECIEYALIEKIVPVRVKANASRFQMAVTATLGIRAALSEGWAVGRMLSRGHGSLVKARRV